MLGVGLLMSTLTASAQTRQIEYGTFTIASLDQNVQGGFFNFNASEGDFISVEAVALSGSLDPRVTLLNTSSTTLAVNSDDPFQPGIGDARLTYRIPATSSYTLLVEAENGTDGQYLLRLERRDLPPTTPLSVGVITTASISPDVPAQAYTFDSAAGTSVSVTSATPGLAYVAEIYGPNGQTLAIHNGGLAASGTTTVTSGTGEYTLVIGTGNASAAGNVEINFASGTAPVQAAAPSEAEANTPDTETAPVPSEPPTDTVDTTETTADGEAQTDAQTDTPSADGEAQTDAQTDTPSTDGEAEVGAETVGSDFPTNRCNVVPEGNNGVVIRQGPDTDFPAIASIPAGEFRFAEATDGAWIRLVGGGWVSSGVVDLNGPCGALPLVSVPTEPESGQPNAPAQPTSETVNPLGQR